MATKRPEIELEVSCGGTFRIATEEMACRITVLDPTTRTALAPVSPEPTAVPVPEDPFYRQALERFLDMAGAVAVDLTEQAGMTAEAGGEERVHAGRQAVDALRERVSNAVAELPGQTGMIQSRIVNLRFTLSFLKNHPLFARQVKSAADEITVSRAEVEKLAAKIGEALALAKEVSTQIEILKQGLGGGGGASVSFLPDIDGLADAGRRLFDGAFVLAVMAAMKEADESVDAEDAAQQAEERLAALLAEAAPPADSAETEEMSDEEALKKLAEFGLA